MHRAENINKNGIRKSVTSHETEYEKLCNAFFEVLFTYKCEEVINLLEVFTDENIECLCDFLIQAQNLRYLKDRKISGKLRNCLVNCTEKTTGILMLKKYFGFELAVEEDEVIERAENIVELEKAISMEYGKEMKIKIIDGKTEQVNKIQSDPIDNLPADLDIPINIIED